MFESKAECIANCLQTNIKTYVLAREFGVNSTDFPAVNPRREIQIQLATFYPDVSINSVTISSADSSGNFEYNIIIE